MDEDSFRYHFSKCRRILILVGAGLSIPSGFPSLRTVCPGAMDIVTREYWDTDPSAVWQYYQARRHQALGVKPNRAHKAIAQLALKSPLDKILTVTHNVDDLNLRAGHPKQTLVPLLGNIFWVRCTNFRCNYFAEDRSDPIVPALASAKFNDPIYIDYRELPTCPKCNNMLRPGCVWFGDPMATDHIKQIDEFILSDQVDLVLLVGMSGTVYPTLGFVDEAVLRGAKVAVFNIDTKTKLPGQWFFHGDVTETLPRVFEPWIGVV